MAAQGQAEKTAKAGSGLSRSAAYQCARANHDQSTTVG